MGVYVQEYTHFVCRHYCVGNLVVKWKYVKIAHLHGRNVSAMQSYVKHWVIVPCHKVGTGIERWKSVNC
jgi:hypothetical protein